MVIEQVTTQELDPSGRSVPAGTNFTVPTVELDALWASFWSDRSQNEVRTQLAHAYEFVIPCVIRALGRGFKSYWEKGELHALGYIGLLQSIDNFAPGSVAGQFPAYATPRVRGVIMDELRHLDFFPRAMRENVNRIKEATERLTTERGEQPSRATIADAAGLSHEQGEKVLAAMHSIYFLHLDQHISRQGTELPASETIPTAEPGPEAKVLEASNREELIQALLELPPRERAALSFRYFGKLTQIQIAGLLGVSHSRICQIEKNALDHLRTKLLATSRPSRNRVRV
jgi:RNA polymerase sigma factor for flagellar operon FliA